ncbi:hypothetical protein CR513_26736, partial [Mucuna pruriens]
MSNLAAKLKSLKLEPGEDLIMHLVLISLLTHSERTNGLSVNLYLTVCKRKRKRQEEEMMQRVKTESAHFVLTSQNKKRKNIKDTCGPFPTASWNRQQYFIMFIDDYSRYGYLYLIHEKSQSLYVFKSFKAEKIKAVKSDCDGEYYGKYDRSGKQRLRPFALFLKECGIVLQYTMPGKPSMNDSFFFTIVTLGEALKTAVHILNRVPTKAINKTPYELWTDKKPSINHLHIWGCPTELRPYRSHERKLDSGTVICYFVGYVEHSWSYKFYDSTSRSFFETGNARILEEVEFGKEGNIRNLVFEEEFVNDIGQVLVPISEQDYDEAEALPQTLIEQPQQPQEEIHQREEAFNSDDYIIFLQEHEDYIHLTEDDPINFYQAMQSFNSQKWIDAMKDELKSKQDNDIWDLVKLPEGVKPIGCKWIFKTKKDSKGNIERYKARLVAKGFTQKEGIDYNETFSSISSKDSFRTVMALVAHFDL